MILHCTYEELTALCATASRVVSTADDSARVAAPPEALADVMSLQPRLRGDLAIHTLEEQRVHERATEPAARARDEHDAVAQIVYSGL